MWKLSTPLLSLLVPTSTAEEGPQARWRASSPSTALTVWNLQAVGTRQPPPPDLRTRSLPSPRRATCLISIVWNPLILHPSPFLDFSLPGILILKGTGTLVRQLPRKRRWSRRRRCHCRAAPPRRCSRCPDTAAARPLCIACCP
jgi:hypothetical protein